MLLDMATSLSAAPAVVCQGSHAENSVKNLKVAAHISSLQRGSNFFCNGFSHTLLSSSICSNQSLVNTHHGHTISPLVRKVSVAERRRISCVASASLAVRDQAEAAFSLSTGPDMFVLDLAEKLQEQQELRHSALPQHATEVLESLSERCSAAGLSMSWPSTREEAFRFTDFKTLKAAVMASSDVEGREDGRASVRLEEGAEATALTEAIQQLTLEEADGSRLVFVDGVFRDSYSNLTDVPEAALIGSLSSLSETAIQAHVSPNLGVLQSASSHTGLFSNLNGIGVHDIAVVVVPDGVVVERPLHLIFASTGGSHRGDSHVLPILNPRVLIVVGRGSSIEVVEEYVSCGERGSKPQWTNSVMEASVGEKGRLRHAIIQSQGRDAYLTRHSIVSQGEASEYSLVEAQLGSRLSRHDVHVQQEGPDTLTELSTFALAADRQLQDLHSRLLLSHPRGRSKQLHKCLVTHATGHAVFDGNVRVTRLAQQTDAGQLSRSLLLAPRGTVNIKPNLQIIADDVKCTHGAAISDLEDDQLFYFRARGIDEQSARSALVFSFAAEVLEKLPSAKLRRRIETSVKTTLLEEGAMDSSVAAGLVGTPQ
eukprot:TRINITY_DN38809_c0_g1_i1.p1 TRINITY_DN38809_c0_g1~~TRINITY_DN38809_c0_g1_i1.p1  ORF type:complete len:597 (-),score=82.57 TRINITY_DN38809_c0_g1_i1:530-2320(-)